MNVRRALPLSASVLVLTLGSLSLGACGEDDPDVVYVTQEAGTDGGRREGGVVILDDAGEDPVPTVCQPQTPPARPFITPPPFQNRCSLATIDAIFKGCRAQGASNAACQSALDQASDDCFDCLFNAAGANPNAALVQYDGRVPYISSLGTCLTAVRGDTDPSGCAVAIGELDTCTKLACVGPCREGTQEEEVNCEILAAQSVCYSTASRKVFSEECQKEIDDGKFDACIGAGITNDQFEEKVMRISCGPNPDGGGGPIVHDAGSDADAETDADIEP
ncbi:MAG: hypothetical protein KIT84_39545 [Labilithrix sp.]|nr:hypothetical protein [Labilithrix sp.]MCW5817158.1 hypothetical protein [Labilithrix sp.]